MRRYIALQSGSWQSGQSRTPGTKEPRRIGIASDFMESEFNNALIISELQARCL